MTELSLHILDIIENSISGGAKNISTFINEDGAINLYEIKIVDNGIGMDAETLKKVQDPFFTTRTTRKIGMGISLFKQATEQCGGTFTIQSKPNLGTEVTATMQLNHIDRQPLGDIAGVFVQLYCSYPGIAFKYIHTTPNGSYAFDTVEINGILGEQKRINSEIRNFLKQMIQENLDELKVSK